MIFIWRIVFLIYMIILGISPAFGDAFKAGNRGQNRVGNSEQKERSRWGRDPFYRERRTRIFGTERNTAGKRSGEKEEPEQRDEEPGKSHNLSLSAIIFRDGVGVAIINDRIVRMGDAIEKGVKVSDILTDRVVLLEGERLVVLRVRPFGR